MKVKRYIGNDPQETMLKIKSELGSNAVILHSRKIKKPGIFGFMKKPLIEMVAAIEENKEKQEKDALRGRIGLSGTNAVHSEGNKIDLLQNQVGNIENLLNNVLNKIGYSQDDKEDSQETLYKKYHDLLVLNDIEPELADRILAIVRKQVSFAEGHEEAILKTIRIVVREYLETPETIGDSFEKNKVVVFVGPTGVGKTTTLAKLAAKLSITKGKRVGVITSDTYRIAAVEQLKIYSEILSIPIRIVYEPTEIAEAIEAFSDRDIILVDTAGRNHKNEEQLKEIKALLENIKDPEIFLVMSATTGNRDMASIVKYYQFIQSYKIIFTKLDEAVTVGNILNAKLQTGKKLSYITTGQSVPDDLEIAHPDKLANMIVGEIHE
ncbi:flagellar biosynthesis protein FlhF [Geosporobacter ferrireducens]|uniref:Flagellar biosynthesis protein FlhF n=1 Tax=Geosporobacter ferrireducens TaxID=1424294 RepID=A0A1D8GBI4_9FIRM|nr:flagellar biosynthesis protein FlhF [Geosporobacter ferrireducens]AOT68262.1 flagellar biosynthesis protein FlhF [Geosporobacter ferrireducens]MTI57316.1 flagellar biosynthesis protein FlhF [Geosporobacter ferrireducens]